MNTTGFLQTINSHLPFIIGIATFIIILIIALVIILFIINLIILNRYKQNEFKLSEIKEILYRQQGKNESYSKITENLTRELSQDTKEKMLEQLTQQQFQQQRLLSEFKETIQQSFSTHRAQFDERQINTLKLLQDSIVNGTTESRNEIKASLKEYLVTLGNTIEKLTSSTDNRLKEISGQVEKRLSEGFEKTTATFADVVKRLALIDEAQKKITELSSNVVGLQEILSDKRSRGAFGEVQLASLVRNVLPEKSFALQHTLTNGKRVDCMLFLPSPTGNIAIDSKFPLESYQKMMVSKLPESEKRIAEQQFKADIKKHVLDISSKYIIPNETSDGAVMFIPAEAVFAEIHSHYPELVEASQKARVWMVSPTTLMAILTTARAVIKDEATRQQIHIIRDHLGLLAKDFERFQVRMDNLAKHVKQAHDDVQEVHTSARKITSRFGQIEKAELDSIMVENKDQ